MPPKPDRRTLESLNGRASYHHHVLLSVIQSLQPPRASCTQGRLLQVLASFAQRGKQQNEGLLAGMPDAVLMIWSKVQVHSSELCMLVLL